ncbi:MAG: diaminopimelate decarboxylase [Bacteroidales bacterium]|nr:diaminopimelate decarboxylase [Bacteroidales bacterium]
MTTFSKDIIQQFGQMPTPFYYYDMALLDQTIQSMKKEADRFGFVVHYALKANSNPEILNRMQEFGLGADCVSGNEVSRALDCGFKSEQIVFAGVGKSDAEIKTALSHDILAFNCESVQELEVIDQIAGQMGKTANIALRLNPNVSANTHKYITTGLEENKFGINQWELETVVDKLKQLKNIKLTGLHFHIGSQITDLNAYKSLCLKINEFQTWFQHRHFKIPHLNVGGGLGIDYHHPDENSIVDFGAYFKVFHDYLELLPGQTVHFELGRSVVANCGSLISKVLYIKNGINTNFMILDAGMTELIRPALYQAYHKIEKLTNTDGKLTRYDVVGPICESSDCFGKAMLLPETKRGDLIAIRSAGAYGEVMSSNYNLREKVKAFYSKL